MGAGAGPGTPGLPAPLGLLMVEDGPLPSRLLSAVSQQAQQLGVHNSLRREEAALPELGVWRAGACRASQQPTAVQEGSPLTEIIPSHGAKPTGLSGQVQKMRGMRWDVRRMWPAAGAGPFKHLTYSIRGRPGAHLCPQPAACPLASPHFLWASVSSSTMWEQLLSPRRLL